MMSIVSPRYDIARFGAENMRASPRQADMLILSGRVSIKMAPVVRRIYDQMLEPKWVIAMGACSSSGGMFANYAVVQGADKFMPVDIHVPGCPPRPEALMYGFNKLQRMILGNPDPGWRQRYNAVGTEEWAREATGEADAGGDRGLRGARELPRRRGDRGRRPRAEAQRLMPDAPGLELIAQELNERTPRARSSAPTTSTARRCLIVDPERILDVLGWLRDTPGQEYRFLVQPPRRRLPARRAALRRRLRAAQHAAGRAPAGPGAPSPTRAASELPELDSCVELFPPPSSRSARSTTSSGSSSAATRTCGGS